MTDAIRTEPTLLHRITPEQFESFICDRLEALGLNAQRLGSVNRKDGGIDILFWPRATDAFPFLGAAQVKHHRERVKQGVSGIREFAGAIAGRPFNAGIFVTNTTFTPDALWFARQQAVLLRLRDYHDLRRWIANDFASEEEWREIPESIKVAPGVTIKSPRRKT